jgi:hypothetical protein
MRLATFKLKPDDSATGALRISASLILFIADSGSGFVSVPCEWYVRFAASAAMCQTVVQMCLRRIAGTEGRKESRHRIASKDLWSGRVQGVPGLKRETGGT